MLKLWTVILALVGFVTVASQTHSEPSSQEGLNEMPTGAATGIAMVIDPHGLK